MKKLMFKSSIVTMLCVLCSLSASAEGKLVLFKYGNFDTWVTRQIHESAVIGGNTKTLYEIGPNRALPGNANRIRQTGFSKVTTVPGKDYCVALLLLQRRHEDAHGNITAQRVGTVVVKYGKSTNGWVEDATYEIHYGNITGKSFYDASMMGLRSTDYARNSKGKSVLVKETGWADADATPTHIVLQFSSSHGGAYVGTVGNTFWVDNVGLVY